MHLTEREQEIVALLRRDPMLKAAQIAERLGTTASAVSVHLSNLTRKGVVLGRGYLLNDVAGVVVVGGANVDIKARSAAPVTPGTSNPGDTSIRAGGVGRNIAENLARLGTRTHLVSVVGRDPLAETLIAQTSGAGVLLDHLARTDGPTGTYTAVIDHEGELVTAVAAMTATASLGPEHVSAARDLIASAGAVVADGNLRADTLAYTLESAATAGVRAFVEPVSVPKARSLAPHLTPERPVFAITPNRDELSALTGREIHNASDVRCAAEVLHGRGVELVWVSMGSKGSVLCQVGANPVRVPPVRTVVADVTGAGDAALAGFAHALLGGATIRDAAHYGHIAAALTLASTFTVRPDLTDQQVRSEIKKRAEEKR